MKFDRVASYPAPIRLAIFLVILLLLWLPIAAPINFIVMDRNSATILTMGLLFVEFLLLLRIWGKKVYRQSHLLKNYGLVSTQQNLLDLLKGLDIALVFTLGLFAIEGIFGLVIWQNSEQLPRTILEGLISALGVGFAEELVFRGWLLDELQRDYRPNTALWVNAIIFASLHFLKPFNEMIRTLPTFPALLLLGLTLVWAKRGSKGKLGLSIGLHAGLVWGYYIINVGQLVNFSDRVPEWVTGIDKNPLAGVMGLIFLGILAFWMRKRAKGIESDRIFPK
ncbi:CPBP family intramembrane metalloprotease [Planktothrix sp. FACHB-1355]|uniref:CPBP family intramembrane metalloprotease n=1 Tax=Aerosakkonema funiforme FACHB-1375 TaxID=2949571 RepID=A0A926VE75_9CYAN|nr:CPBP family intramembrane metalloprotease [Aerosakkonema funiforme FACHB-1375]MBD3561768.1 CPBP family intramembrane metalloprotease [Planktothrix sp. FACHB-1355]